MGEKKPEMEQRSREELQTEVKDIGVVIEQFGFIGSPRPPESVVAAINSAQQAKYIAEQKQNELQQSQADAAKRVAAAEGEAKAQVAIAQGEAESNRVRAASISPQIIEWQKLAVTDRWITKWNGAVPSVQTGGGVPGLLLNINPEK
jgi:regulator of protease activity HflC (stomatin/prohibitin superfamily)